MRLCVEEDKDASIPRFMSELNREIANQLETFPFSTYKRSAIKPLR